MYTWDKELNRIKNPYNGGYGDVDLSSLSDDNLIPVNTTIKPIDREDSNTEIESGEVVFHPDGKLFTALGKKHKYGGTPVNLPSDSFIYSDHRPLAITKEDKKLFDFKTGSAKQINNTPAKIVQRELDIEHHNRMIAIQQSDKHDLISKKSSELMLDKNFKKLGQVAYLQEEYKGFPQGLPQFSQGTAPVEDPQKEAMAKQYQKGGFMQLGGPYASRRNKPVVYDPSAPAGYIAPQWGLWQGDKSNDFIDKNGVSNRASNIADLDATANQFGYTGPKDNIEFQKFLYNKSPENKALVDNSHEQYEHPYIGNPSQGTFDGKFGIRWNAILDTPNLRPGIRKKSVTDFSPAPTPGGNPVPMQMDPKLTSPDSPAGNANPSILPYEPNVPLSPDQLFSLGASAYNAASINKYAPKRMQTSFTPVNLERVNAQPYLNQINNQVQQAYGNNQVTNPIVGRASNSQVYGKSLDQVSQTLGNIDNQNRQISNQENMYNNQGNNQNNARNVQLDNTYYNQVQAMNQNYDNESRFARNRLTDQYSQYKSQNDSLEMQLASQPTFGTVWVDPKTGQHVDTQGMDEQTLYKKGLRKQAAPLYDYNAKRNSIYYTGAGIDMNNLPSSTGNYKDQLLKGLMAKYNSGNITDNELKTLGYISKGIK